MPDQSLSTHVEAPISIGPVMFDPRARALNGGGRTVRLEPRLGDLLAYLTRRHGDVVSRGELIDDIWGDDGSDEALTQAVARLRRALKDLGGDPDAIETLPKVGYRMRIHGGPAGVRTAPLQHVHAPLSPLASHSIAFGAGMLVMLLLAFAWFAIAMKPVTVERQVVRTNPPLTAEER
jgi:DNA-binding winged helix-turn-helix (wHTH) protein